MMFLLLFLIGATFVFVGGCFFFILTVDLYRGSLALSVAGGIAYAMFYGLAVTPFGRA